MRALVLVIVVLATLVSCGSNSSIEEQVDPLTGESFSYVGNLPVEKQSDFKLCEKKAPTAQYFWNGRGLEYEGEITALKRIVLEQYQPVPVKESGLIRIRFLVNCKGETGRFHLQGMDWNYQPFEFDSRITEQLLTISKNLSGWQPKEVQRNNRTYSNYYQYLIFKIKDGQIIEIMP